MALIPYVITKIYRDNDTQANVAVWGPMANGDVGVTLDLEAFTAYPDRSVQWEGTPGAGANAVWEGSNDGSNYHALNDHFGNALTFAATGLRGISEACHTARPRVVNGDGTTSWTVTMFMRRGLR